MPFDCYEFFPSSHQLMPQGQGNGLSAVGHTQLGEDVADMGAGRGAADGEARASFVDAGRN